MPQLAHAETARETITEQYDAPANWQEFDGDYMPEKSIDGTEQWLVVQYEHQYSDTVVSLWLLGEGTIQPFYDDLAGDGSCKWGDVYDIDHLDELFDEIAVS